MIPKDPICEFCGEWVHVEYIKQDGMYWCSQRHYLAWLSEMQRWDDESAVAIGNIDVHKDDADHIAEGL